MNTLNSSADLTKINEAMNCISFENGLLDAALVEIADQLALAIGSAGIDGNLADQESNRASAGCAMALVGVLSGLKSLDEPADLEALMLGIDFLDENDTLDAKIVKGVMLDCLMAEMVSEANDFKDISHSASNAHEMKSLKAKIVEILQRYGYAGHYLCTGSVN